MQTNAPISLTTTAMRRPCSLLRMCWSKVVFPEPCGILVKGHSLCVHREFSYQETGKEGNRKSLWWHFWLFSFGSLFVFSNLEASTHFLNTLKGRKAVISEDVSLKIQVVAKITPSRGYYNLNTSQNCTLRTKSEKAKYPPVHFPYLLHDTLHFCLHSPA